MRIITGFFLSSFLLPLGAEARCQTCKTLVVMMTYDDATVPSKLNGLSDRISNLGLTAKKSGHTLEVAADNRGVEDSLRELVDYGNGEFVFCKERFPANHSDAHPADSLPPVAPGSGIAE